MRVLTLYSRSTANKSSIFSCMAKVKYYYDSETLSYRKIEQSKGTISKIVVLITFSTLLVMLSGFIVLSQFLKTPDQLAQERELENLKFNYELLNKRLDESSSIFVIISLSVELDLASK